MGSLDLGRGREGSRSSDEGPTLRSYLNVLRERAWVVVVCVVLVTAAAVAYVELAPKKYQATAELEVQAANPNDSVLATLPVLHSSGDPTEDVLTGASLVTTPTVARAVVRALGLKLSPGTALADVTANPIGQADLVAVQATASSPSLAERLANGFVQQTIATSTATVHAAINAMLPTLQQQAKQTPPAQRYAPGSVGSQVQELQLLDLRNDPTLMSAATAVLPGAPSSPKRSLTVAAGIIAGLLLGIGAAFAFHALDPRLRREDQIREIFNLPILARIARERRRRRSGPLVPSDLRTSAEGYRTLRATLTARGLSSEPRAYLVTGSMPSEGKSTTAINLAVALAQGGGSLILIEADFRSPTFAKAFGLEPFYGIEQVLAGEVELSEALVRVDVNDTSIDVLAAHGSGGEFADRMSFAAVRKLVYDANALAEFVVIDSPPLTAVIDALPFAQIADEVLIVARLEHSRLGRLNNLEELLRENGVSASGLVLVGADPRPQQYYGTPEPPESRAKPKTSMPSAPSA